MSRVEALLEGWRDARRPALVFRATGEVLDGPTLVAAVERAARWLIADGVVRGATVGVVMTPTAAAIISALGAMRAGAVLLPLSPGATGAELAFGIADGSVVRVVGDPGLTTHVDSVRAAGCAFRAHAEIGGAGADAGGASSDEAPLPGLSDEAPLLLLYTSGTTGRPRGIEHDARSALGAIDALAGAWGIGPGDRVVHALPLFHVHGLCLAMLGALARGATVEVVGFSPAAVVGAVAGGGTLFMGVPTMYVRLVEHLRAHPEDGAVLGRARLFTCGSAPLSEAVFGAFEGATGHRVLERYGMTETMLSLSNALEGERRPGWVGWPVPGFEARVVDDAGEDVGVGTGELEVRGPGLLRGVRGEGDGVPRPRDRWFRTGDLAERDETGAFRILGRKAQDFLKSGGWRIAVRPLEEALLGDSPDAADLAVVGIPDAVWGERVAVVVVPMSADDVDAGAWLVRLQARARARFSDPSTPRAVRVVPSLPRNAMGKVLRPALRALFVAEGGASGLPVA